jgi:hypothetical protein
VAKGVALAAVHAACSTDTTASPGSSS